MRVDSIEVIQPKVEIVNESIEINVGDRVRLSLTDEGLRNRAASDVPLSEREGVVSSITSYDGHFDGLTIDTGRDHVYTPKCWTIEVIPTPMPAVGDYVTVEYNFEPWGNGDDVIKGYYTGLVFRSTATEFDMEDVDILFLCESGRTETVRGNTSSHFGVDTIRRGIATVLPSTRRDNRR